MKLKWVRELCLWALVVSVGHAGGGWVQAQTTTNAAPTKAGASVLAGASPAVVFEKLENKLELSFWLDRIPAMRRDLFGLPLWQYAAACIFILLAFNVSKLLEWLIGGRLQKWAQRAESKLGGVLLKLVHGPVKVVSFVVLLFIGLELFAWPEWLKVWIARGLELSVAFSLTYMAVAFVDVLVDFWRQRAPVGDDPMLREHLLPVVSKSLKIFILIVAVLMTVQHVFGTNIAAPLASLSIGGLAVGLAAQDTLANLFGAVAIFVDKPFCVGDSIKVEAIEGTVESIGLRSTRIRNVDGHLIAVPNKTMGNATITNVTRRPTIKTEMNYGLTYDTPAEKLKVALALLEEIYRQHPMTADLLITFNKFADSALNINVVHWWRNTDYRAYLKGIQELNLTVKQRFDQAGIDFAFPTQTLYVKPGPDGATPAVLLANSSSDSHPTRN